MLRPRFQTRSHSGVVGVRTITYNVVECWKWITMILTALEWMNDWMKDHSTWSLPWSPILASWWGLQGNFSPRTYWGYLGICAFCLWQIVGHIYNLFLACIFSQKHNQLLKENKCYSFRKFWQTTLWHSFQECIVMKKSSLLTQTLSKYPQAPTSYTQTSISRATKDSNWLPSNTASLAPSFHYPLLCGMQAFPL